MDYVALNGDTSDADEEIHNPPPRSRPPTKQTSKSNPTAPITLNPNNTSPIQVIQPQPHLIPTVVGGVCSYGTGAGVYPAVPHNGAIPAYPAQHPISASYTAQEPSNKGGYYIECPTPHSQADLVMQSAPVMSAQGLPQSVVPSVPVPYQQPLQTVPSSAYTTPITIIGLPPSSTTTATSAATVPGIPQPVIFSQSPAIFPYPPSMGMHAIVPPMQPAMQPAMQSLVTIGGRVPESVSTEMPTIPGLMQRPTTIPATSGMVPVVKMEAVTATVSPSQSVLPSSPSSIQSLQSTTPAAISATATATKEEEEVSLEIKTEIKPEPSMSVPIVAKVVSPSSTIPQQPLPMSGTGSGIQINHQSVEYTASSPSGKSISSPSPSSPSSSASSTTGTNSNRIPPNQSTPIPLGSMMSSTPTPAIPTACTIPVYPMNCMTSAQPMASSPMLTMSMMSSPNGTVQYAPVPYPPTYNSSK